MTKSSEAETRRSVMVLLIVAEARKRDCARESLSEFVGGIVPVWSWKAVRRTKSVERARWLTRWAWEVRVWIRVPFVGSHILMVRSRDDV
jgi:hypothetical protein